MFYIKGKITSLDDKEIVIENNQIGYDFLLGTSKKYSINDFVLVYALELQNDFGHYFIAFNDLIEKQLFINLLKVKTIGVKTACSILRNTKIEELINAIQIKDLNFFINIDGIGKNSAYAIIDKLSNDSNFTPLPNDQTLLKVRDYLKKMGYSYKEIDEKLAKINKTFLSDEEIIKEFIKRSKDD